MSTHATLSPSSAERWISCPASVQLIAQFAPPEVVSPYALEGTAAHALAELRASVAFGYLTSDEADVKLKKWRVTYDISPETEEEMERHVAAYVKLLQERASKHPYTQVRLEQRVDSGVPSCWGTADAILVSPVHVEIVDFKYGRGVQVEAEDNPQLKLYAVGALDSYGDILGETEVVYWTIHQPRLNHTPTAEMPAEELRAWRDGLVPIAVSAVEGTGKFGPSEAACRWCPLSGRCAAQMEHALEQDFGTDPDMLSPEDMAEALERAPFIADWLAALEKASLHMAYSLGKPIPGYKIVMSGGRRSLSDDYLEEVGEVLHAVGFTSDQFSKRSLLGIGKLQKLLGGEKGMNELLGSFISKSEGKPSIVPESDRRPAVSPESQALHEFDPITEPGD